MLLIFLIRRISKNEKKRQTSQRVRWYNFSRKGRERFFLLTVSLISSSTIVHLMDLP